MAKKLKKDIEGCRKLISEGIKNDPCSLNNIKERITDLLFYATTNEMPDDTIYYMEGIEEMFDELLVENSK